MVNYKSSQNDEEGASLIGGALDMLNQYEANSSGDEYSAKNPTESFLSQEHQNELKNVGGSLIGGSKIGGSFSKHLENVMKLAPKAHHALTMLAPHMKNMGIHHGVLDDISKSTSPLHLAKMIHKEYLSGGNFLDDFGKTMSSLTPLLPLLL
tara:strand:- start:1358 stop:1813 length:456 start_codon:yes stop_codon:yes gene_type:complete